MFRKLALSGRVTATVVGIIVVFVGVCIWLTSSYRTAAYEAKRVAIRQLVEVGTASVQYYVALEKQGALTTEEAQKQACASLKALRYDGEQYFWINDTQHKMIMHPTSADMVGKVLTDYKDPTGRAIFIEFVDVATKQGAGLVEYQWPKPGSTSSEPKFAYVKYVPDWKWVVGSGVYVDQVEHEVQAQMWIIGIISLLATLAAAAAVWLLLRSTVHPVLHAVGVLSRGAEEVTEASRQVSAASQSLSQGATEQAASLEETSASMEEMASMTRQNAENAGRAATLMAQTERQVQDANTALAHLVASMNGIQESSGQVAKIIRTIDEIAFQTNILALNAAVEAARAGEAGMGFAVVADEVRNLAQRAAQAARDTSVLIEQAGEKARDGNTKVAGVATVTAAITKSSLEVKALIDEISVASRQQTQGIDQVTQAVTQMEKLTQTTAATAEESAAASEELSAQAETTHEVVAQLGRLVGAASSESASPLPSPRPGTAGKVLQHKPAAAPKRFVKSAEAAIPMEDTGTFGRF
jgi:methyl-accepting chemotaxis protein